MNWENRIEKIVPTGCPNTSTNLEIWRYALTHDYTKQYMNKHEYTNAALSFNTSLVFHPISADKFHKSSAPFTHVCTHKHMWLLSTGGRGWRVWGLSTIAQNCAKLSKNNGEGLAGCRAPPLPCMHVYMHWVTFIPHTIFSTESSQNLPPGNTNTPFSQISIAILMSSSICKWSFSSFKWYF